MRVRVAAVAVWALTAACGARTPLLLGGASDDDSSADDASAPVDGSPDAIVVPDCVSAGAKLVYFVTNTTPIQLYSIDPASGTAVEVGALDCAMSDVPNAFSMAVDRKGNAYLLTTDLGSPAQGAMWQVSTTTAHCEPVLDYARGQLGFSVFGMAFATNGAGSSSETLYIEGAADLGSVAAFGTLDTARAAHGDRRRAAVRALLHRRESDESVVVRQRRRDDGGRVHELDERRDDDERHRLLRRVVGRRSVRIFGKHCASPGGRPPRPLAGQLHAPTGRGDRRCRCVHVRAAVIGGGNVDYIA
jgi:hypothetical protein